MTDSLQILTGPVTLAGRLPFGALSLAVAIDAAVRRARGSGADAGWSPVALAGDPATQHAVDQELAREGLDRGALGREGFGVRVAEFQASQQAAALATMAALGVAEPRAPVATDDAEMADAARVAFVRLYEAGLLSRSSEVVDVCPRCLTVVEGAEVVPATIDADRVVVTVPFASADGELYLGTTAPELLAGCVAVAVPPGHMGAGRRAVLPLDDRVVPVVVDRGARAARFVVPAHDADDLPVALGNRLVPIEVYGTDGVVTAGPQVGLRRFAARAAARRQLEDADLVVGIEAGVDDAGRCARCGTVVAPHLGEHWFLDVDEIEIEGADAIRDTVAFTPPTLRDEVLAAAGAGGTWCISHRLWSGVPVPAVECLDCGTLDVTVDAPACRRCAGAVTPDPGVLDARFVAALWPLVAGGWNGRDPVAPAEGAVVLAVLPDGAARDVIRTAALSLRLGRRIPFERVVTPPAPDAGPDRADDGDRDDDEWAETVDELVAHWGPRTVRAALAAGRTDLDEAFKLVAAVDSPPPGEGDVDAVLAFVDEALAAGDVRQALSAVAGLVAEGVRPAAVDRVRALAVPLLGA